MENHSKTTISDREILMVAFVDLGESFPTRLNTSFFMEAISFYNLKENTIFRSPNKQILRLWRAIASEPLEIAKFCLVPFVDLVEAVRMV